MRNEIFYLVDLVLFLDGRNTLHSRWNISTLVFAILGRFIQLCLFAGRLFGRVWRASAIQAYVARV